MNLNATLMVLTIGILVILVTACDGERQDRSSPNGSGNETSPGSGLESKYPTATWPANVGDGEQGQERDAVLDKVNLAPDRPEDDQGKAVEGPAPGTESLSGDAPVLAPTRESDETGQTNGAVESNQAQQGPAGPKEPVSGEDSEGIPSLEERNAMLEGVNQGPDRSGRDDGGATEGPAPGTGSD